MALVVGAISAGVAYVLLWLISLLTNLAFFHRWSSAAVLPQDHHLGLWSMTLAASRWSIPPIPNASSAIWAAPPSCPARQSFHHEETVRGKD